MGKKAEALHKSLTGQGLASRATGSSLVHKVAGRQAKTQEVPVRGPDFEASQQKGHACRQKLPRSNLGKWEVRPDRGEAVDLIFQQDADRLSFLVPERHRRMAASPFAFFRGAAHVYGDFEGRFGRPPEQKDFVVSRRCQKPCELTITSHDLTPLMAQIGENSLVDFETSTSGADGDPVWYRYQSVVLYDEEGGPVRHVGRLLDTSEAAMRESQFRRKAERDSLTGLYNRAAALDRIETALRTESRPCTLIVVDVDDFKAVNDSYGHPEGDYVLKRLAIFLSQVMRKEDIVARIGGDEFLIFAPGLGSGPAADRVLEHLARGPFAGQRATDEVTDTAYHAAPTISVGAACCLTPPMPFDVLYAAADSTLYQVKEAGKAQYLLTVIG